MIPTYRQKLNTIKPTTKTVRKRTADSTIALKACLDSTDWQMFKDSCPDFDAYTDTVTAYISWCEETCYESRLVTVYGNDKPWFTRDIKQKLAMKKSAFISGNRESFGEPSTQCARRLVRPSTNTKANLKTNLLPTTPDLYGKGYVKLHSINQPFTTPISPSPTN